MFGVTASAVLPLDVLNWLSLLRSDANDEVVVGTAALAAWLYILTRIGAMLPPAPAASDVFHLRHLVAPYLSVLYASRDVVKRQVGAAGCPPPALDAAILAAAPGAVAGWDAAFNTNDVIFKDDALRALCDISAAVVYSLDPSIPGVRQHVRLSGNLEGLVEEKRHDALVVLIGADDPAPLRALGGVRSLFKISLDGAIFGPARLQTVLAALRIAGVAVVWNTDPAVPRGGAPGGVNLARLTLEAQAAERTRSASDGAALRAIEAKWDGREAGVLRPLRDAAAAAEVAARTAEAVHETTLRDLLTLVPVFEDLAGTLIDAAASLFDEAQSAAPGAAHLYYVLLASLGQPSRAPTPPLRERAAAAAAARVALVL